MAKWGSLVLREPVILIVLNNINCPFQQPHSLKLTSLALVGIHCAFTSISNTTKKILLIIVDWEGKVEGKEKLLWEEKVDWEEKFD